MKKKNSAFCRLLDSKLLAQYWKNYYVGITSSPAFEEWQIGKAMDTIWWTNAKYDMEDGELQRNNEDIGNSNCVAGWKLNVEDSKPVEITVFIGAASRRPALYRRMRQVQQEPVESMYNDVQEKWIKWLSKKRLLDLPEYPGFGSSKLDIIKALTVHCLP
ncbi:MAG: hypothetical protein R2741_13940 [Methanolobus sp.]